MGKEKEHGMGGVERTLSVVRGRVGVTRGAYPVSGEEGQRRALILVDLHSFFLSMEPSAFREWESGRLWRVAQYSRTWGRGELWRTRSYYAVLWCWRLDSTFGRMHGVTGEIAYKSSGGFPGLLIGSRCFLLGCIRSINRLQQLRICRRDSGVNRVA